MKQYQPNLSGGRRLPTGGRLAGAVLRAELPPSFVAARSAEQRTDCRGLRWAIAAESVSRLAAAAATCLVFLPDASGKLEPPGGIAS